MDGLIQLIGGSWQDSLQNLVAFGTLVMTLTQSDNQIPYLYSNLSPAVLSPVVNAEVCQGITFKIPLDANGNIVASPAYSVYANNILDPPNSYYLCTVYSERGELLWGPNPQQVTMGLSPVTTTFDVGQWVPGQIQESY
jgi:hypothetical protein